MSFKSKVVVFGFSDFSEPSDSGDASAITTNRNYDIFLSGMPCMFTYHSNPNNPSEQYALIEDLYYTSEYDPETKEASHGHITIEFSMEEGKRFMEALDQAGMNQKIDYEFPKTQLDLIAEAKRKVQKGINLMKGVYPGETPALT